MKITLTITFVALLAVCGFGQEQGVALFPVIKDGKWGYIDKTGKLAIKPQFDMAWDFSEGLASVQVGMKRGYIDARGEIVIKPQFDMSRPFCNGLAAVYTNALPWGNFIVFNRGVGAWGYIDKSGKVVINTPCTALAGEFKYDNARGSYDVNRSHYQGWIQKDGRIWSSTWYYLAGDYCEGLAVTQVKKGKFAYVDTNHVEVTRRIYEGAGDFAEGLAPVALLVDVDDPARATAWTKSGQYMLGMRNAADKTWGTNAVMLEAGETVAFGGLKTFVFQVTAPAKEGKYNFQWQMQQGNAGFGDLSSNLVVSVVAAPAKPWQDVKTVPPVSGAQAAAAGKQQVNGARFVSMQVPAEMTAGQVYTVAVTMKNTGALETKWGYIDRTDKMIIPPQFNAASSFAGGLAAVKSGEKWGYIDKTGKVAVKPEFDGASRFSEGLGRIVVGGRYGFVDASGKVVIEPKFTNAWDFSLGLARVAVGVNEGYIDRTGKFVWEPAESPYVTVPGSTTK